MRIRWWVEGTTTPKLQALIAEPDSVLGGPGSVAREQAGRKRLYRVDGAPDEADLFVKVFTLPAGLARLRYLLRPSKARREARIARDVVALGFDAAVPLAVGEQRRLGLLVRSFSVIRELPAPDLRAVLRDPELDGSQLRELLDGFARFSRRLHDAGVDQDDFSPNNFLMYPDGRVVLIDFERCRIQRGPLGSRGYTLLAKLARREPTISRSYLGEADRARRRAVCAEIRGEFRRVRRRDARRAGKAAFKAGRSLAREGDIWTVRVRAGARLVELQLDPSEAREAWRRAHQLERLELPALRPVRLQPGGVALEHPGDATELDENSRVEAIKRALRALELYGHFTRKPEWLVGPDGARLRNPLAFELDL